MLYLITGGSGSGKSEYAENLAMQLGSNRYYIATMKIWDEECRERVKKHRTARKNKGFVTVECHTDLQKLEFHKKNTDVLLLECMSNLVANEMFSEGAKSIDEIEAKVINGVKKLTAMSENVIIVSNEIFSDGAIYEETTANYQELLGKINREIAAMADQAMEIVYGIAAIYKK